MESFTLDERITNVIVWGGSQSCNMPRGVASVSVKVEVSRNEGGIFYRCHSRRTSTGGGQEVFTTCAAHDLDPGTYTLFVIGGNMGGGLQNAVAVCVGQGQTCAHPQGVFNRC